MQNLVYCLHMPKRVEKQREIEEIEVGDEIISWETWEYPPYDRSRWWYAIAGLIGSSLIIYAVLTANFLFAIIVLMMGVITLVNSLKQPDRIAVYITTHGVAIGQEFYPYKEIKDFSIIYEPPEVKLIYLDFLGVLRPTLGIPLEDTDPNLVREALLPYAFENLEREDENLTDMVRRLYKI